MDSVLYVSSDHRQRTIHRSIEQGWEGLHMKQDHRSIGPQKPCEPIEDHRSIDHSNKSHVTS